MIELHVEQRSPNSLIMRREFSGLPALRIAIMKNRERRFTITPPASMTAGDRTALLNMRADGFNIEIK
ncbi:hypothetical protein [Bradyrhizobium sp. JYMT SZCCT0428]|uniref:hypothetical protein n=1 Tax=Bradyrhizobium sp. JYMT SZCCT0428 TaxID=2807673 RepID=UPI001BA4EDCF|nr:hypothetical protein [Bradyrhizobium sp. JYMT SZCCT0428]MBR1157037.1 hypothetical protein [Bradyrhizobium sp. JYMT SZCCT0428]